MARMNAWVSGAPDQVQQLRNEEERKLTRDFEHLRKRYGSMLGLPLTRDGVPQWEEVEDIRFVRHAIIHNQGLYTDQYVRRSNARTLTEDAFGIIPPREQWVDRELIPLDEEFVRSSLDLLLETARYVSAKLGG